MPFAPYDLSISAARAGALFASPLQRSDEPSARQVQRAIATAIGAHGVRDCAAGSRKPTASTPRPRSAAPDRADAGQGPGPCGLSRRRGVRLGRQGGEP